MKQLKNKTNTSESLSHQIFNGPFCVIQPAFLQMQVDINMFNILLFQNKGKSPPGCPRSPGTDES